MTSTPRPRTGTASRRVRAIEQHRLGHAIEQRCCQRTQWARIELARQCPHDAALDPTHGVESADVSDVGGLAGPG